MTQSPFTTNVGHFDAMGGKETDHVLIAGVAAHGLKVAAAKIPAAIKAAARIIAKAAA